MQWSRINGPGVPFEYAVMAVRDRITPAPTNTRLPAPAQRSLTNVLRNLHREEASEESGAWLFARVTSDGVVVRFDRAFDSWPAWYQVQHASQGPSLDDLAWEMGQRAPQWRPTWASLLPPPERLRAAQSSRRSDRPPGELVARGELQLAQHRGHVGLDGLDRDEQLGADLLVGVAARDQPHHLALALGEPVEVLVDGRDLDGAGERVEHEPRQPRREHRVAGGHPLDRGDQLRTGDRLGDVAARTGPDRADHVLGRVRDGQCEEPRGHSCFAAAAQRNPPHHLGATTAGQVYVEQHHLRLVLEYGGHGLVDVGRLGDDVDRGAELGADAGAEHGVVVDDHDGARDS